jgi:hypothetical protein
MSPYLRAAEKLHHYMVETHWDGQALVGPDPGVRFNYRIGRFIKSYLANVPWNDELYYLQGQGYWSLCNWSLYTQTENSIYRDIALRCSAFMLQQQRGDGAWDYPNPEWRQRVATVEGIWGSLGLLESYRKTHDAAFLAGALRWHEYLITEIGFQENGDELAINYFANRAGDRVPNNSICLLRFLAELADVTNDGVYLKPCKGLLTFAQRAQKATGEFPYAVAGTGEGQGRSHFQCYQYNAFQCLDLIRYFELSRDSDALALISSVLSFLRGGLAQDGHALYQCDSKHRAVTYHATVLGAAFLKGDQSGLDDYKDLADRAYAYVLRLQRPDGSLIHSQRDYYLLGDRRSYPRYLAMILHHLLLKCEAMVENARERDQARVAVR